MIGHDFLLQSFGVPAYSLQNGLSTEIINKAALKMNELSQAGGFKSCLIDISNTLLPVLEDDKFSSIWFVLFEELSTLCYQEDVQAVYCKINNRQGQVFAQGGLPMKILHKLWLSHLPCLEFAVLKMVEHICSSQQLPVTTVIQDALIKSCVAEVASKEIVVYETVYCMLISITKYSDFATIMIEITAEFCDMVRTLKSQFSFQNWMRNIPTQSENISQIRVLLWFSPDPETLPTLSIVKTLYEMHKIWRNIEPVVSRNPMLPNSEQPSYLNATSHDDLCQHFEDLWCLTIEYRRWMFAAVNNILTCDQQYVESCLWYIAVHHRVGMHIDKCKTLKNELLNLVHGFRNLLHTSSLHSKLASQVIPLSVKTNLDVELSIEKFLNGKEETYQHLATFIRSVIVLLLMMFFFQSDGGFTFGDEVAEFVTSSKDVSDHVRCLIYYHHVLNVTSRQWSSVKCDLFLSYVNILILKLESQNTVSEIPDFSHIYSGLQSLLSNLK